MRIIAGSAKGRRLKTLKGLDKRPTADRVKETIFAVLGKKIQGAEALDLYAGTGNLGIEALSRDAGAVLFVDNDAGAKKIIEENLRVTLLQDRAQIWRCDVFRALRRCRASGRMFDVIFADPPYGKGFGIQTFLALGECGILKQGGIFILEHQISEEVGADSNQLKVFSEKLYGQTAVHFFQCFKTKE